MWVKICANTNLHDAALAAEFGADAVGFVFAPSKRQVTVAQVAEITAELPDTVEKFGVFPPSDAKTIVDAAIESGLTHVQLHGAFSRELVDEIKRLSGATLEVVQVVSVPEVFTPDALQAELTAVLSHVRTALLDASHRGIVGGTGIPFDWSKAAAAVHSSQSNLPSTHILLAGGLNPDNVRQAIDIFQPFGVDVASGVEESPGKKSPEKLRAFIQAAKAAR